MKKEEKVHVGGQAVIEGVMMRSPSFFSVAVRRPDGKIIVKREPFVSLTKRLKFLGWPFLRGGVILIESLVLGIKALNFSGDIAMQEEKDAHKTKDPGAGSKWMMGLTVVFAFVLGLGLFFYLPLVLTELTGVKGSVLFNLVDGLIRIFIFLLYIFLISRWKEIQRVFEYHGAEHKSIFAFEDGKPLTMESAVDYKTWHPRCGTSFLLVVMLVSIMVFVLVGRPENLGERFFRFLFIPVIGGLSYEIIRLAGSKYGKWLSRTLVAPGLWLQRITTREPDEKQMEVALVALKSALDMDIGNDAELLQST